MRILHYFLGFHRAGGLNRYAADLAREQARSGNEVFALFPGGGIFPRSRAVIHACSSSDGVGKYELLGGRAVPLLFGIRDPQMILAGDHHLPEKSIIRFCDALRPDVFHIHTWMGFPEELLVELKRRGTKIVFTTHDYFGLCPKVNFIDAAGKSCDVPDDRKCSICNADAPSEWKLAIRNSRMLLSMKKLLFPRTGFRHRSCCAPEKICEPTTIRDYTVLREHYMALLRQCDVIHANSDVSADVYRRFIPDLPVTVEPISHSGIIDRRRRKTPGSVVKLAFSGPAAEFKGLPRLLCVLEELYRSGVRNWQLDVWGGAGTSESSAVVFRGAYDPSRSRDVFDECDLLIVPSVWNETFGFVVPEALSFGTPVLCSETVGAQRLVLPEMVFRGENGLRDKLKRLLDAPEMLARWNEAICNGKFAWSMSEHTKKMMEIYDGIRK